jgi:pyruvate ferredoxin oxidoreductase beta subunit
MDKVQRALAAEGPAFINVIAPCHRGWRFKPEDAIQMAKLAVATRYWPLYEWTPPGKYVLNRGNPKEATPLVEWLKQQGRFKHLFEPKNEHIIQEIQDEVDRRWKELVGLVEMTKDL